ncbi:MAG: hypothetical protein AAFQ41_16675 [Cyanobacteria bacterium J06623_7]
MGQQKIVTELNNIHQHRQFMAFKSHEVIILKQQQLSTFNFIAPEAIEYHRHRELNCRDSWTLKHPTFPSE